MTSQPRPHSQDAPLDSYRVQRYTVKPSRGRQVLAWLQLGAISVEGLGIDASKWQSSIDFQKAKDNGVKFAFMRSTYGITPDTKFSQHWPGAKEKVLRGLYHYYLDAQDPKQQATAAFNACQGDPGEMPPVLDLEDYGNAKLTASKVHDCLEWLTILFNKTPLIYTGKSVWDKHFGKLATWGLAYPLWLAQYTLVGWQTDHLNKVLLYPPSIPLPFTKWDFWQFSASCPAATYGVSGSVVDVNYAAPGVLAKYGTQPPPIPPPVNGDPIVKFIVKGQMNYRSTPAITATNDIGDFFGGEIITALKVIPVTPARVWVEFEQDKFAALVYDGKIYLDPA